MCNREPLIVTITGHSGSGKTLLAEKLRHLLSLENYTVNVTDDGQATDPVPGLADHVPEPQELFIEVVQA